MRGIFSGTRAPELSPTSKLNIQSTLAVARVSTGSTETTFARHKPAYLALRTFAFRLAASATGAHRKNVLAGIATTGNAFAVSTVVRSDSPTR